MVIILIFWAWIRLNLIMKSPPQAAEDRTRNQADGRTEHVRPSPCSAACFTSFRHLPILFRTMFQAGPVRKDSSRRMLDAAFFHYIHGLGQKRAKHLP
jgi:hypothetical protein